MNEKYINELGIFAATVKRAFERGPIKQSKAAAYIEFERDSDKAICSMRFSNPLNPADLYKIAKVVQELTGKYMKVDDLKKYPQAKVIESLNKLAGTRANVYVRPHDIPGFKKTIWGVEDVVNEKFTVTSASNSGSDLFGDMGSSDDKGSVDGSEDIPF